MDVFAIHPYQERSKIPPTQPHPIGHVDRARPTTTSSWACSARPSTARRSPGATLPIAYTEFGVQSDDPAERAEAAYTNLVSPLGSTPSTSRPRPSTTGQAFELAACQPNVVGIFIFHLPDEADLNRWQSGLYYADGKPKSSLDPIASRLR